MRQANCQPSLTNSKKIGVEGICQLLAEVLNQGYRLIGPTVRDDAVIYDDLTGFEDLPEGYSDQQTPGEYRLEKSNGKSIFGYVVGPQSWKKFLHPPRQRIGVYDRGMNRIELNGSEEDERPLAFFGVRPCELKAIQIQDRVFLEGPFVDEQYRKRRESLFIIGVNCTQPASTCFCASMGSGPSHSEGFDLCLTEIVDKKTRDYLVQVGSEKGSRLLEKVPIEPASETQIHQGENLLEKSARKIERTLETEELPEILNRNFDHPHWEEIANRCLACGNCTLVCPTCFCTTVEETTDLAGQRAERWKLWDSCFTADFSYIHGGSVRPSTRSRYRQWMTHKLSNWVDQFGTMGCVGCGRCLTWCPVGIDITEEAAYIREHDLSRKSRKQKENPKKVNELTTSSRGAKSASVEKQPALAGSERGSRR
ncbi:MAG: 4Fe-4S dicluster domain-containing protein [Candidatus Omnitrophica bacterium]|nr:4Fe-4S dicluster domain-containing protein [Candidatus Omnitrophota bacterium]